MRALVVALLITGGAAVAHAQDPSVPYRPAFSIERLTAAPGPGAFWQVEDGDILARYATAFSLVTSLSSAPLVIRHILEPDRTLSEPVRTRAGAELLAAVGLGGRWQVGLALPIVVYQEGDRLQNLDLPPPDDDEPLATTTWGDIRLHAKMRLTEPPFGQGLAVAVGLVLTLPTGDDEHFAGEAGVVGEPRLIASWRDERFAAAVNLGPRIRGEEVRFLVPGLIFSNELVYGVAGSVRIPALAADQEVHAMAELAGAWGDEGSPSPGEWRLGLRAKLSSTGAGTWTVGAAAGMGFGLGDDSAIGAPAWRLIADVRFESRPRLDSDRDGVPNVIDRCPSEAEDEDGVSDGDGCIDADDDQDGVPDIEDSCPTRPEDRDKFDDKDGCPDADNDGDEILDGADGCPNDREDVDGHDDGDGCPDPDDDGDGLLDAADRCPREPEDKDGVEDGDGCADFDDDGDGVPDEADACLADIEDKDGWEDDDGCQDTDDDRDGVPDSVDGCLDEPETLSSFTDTDFDGCPDGVPLARPAADGTIVLTAEATRELRWKKKDAPLSAKAGIVIDAMALAAHRAGWDTVDGPALQVTVWDDQGKWTDLAEKRSEQVVYRLKQRGIRAVVTPVAAGKGALIVATPPAIEAGARVPVKQKPAP